VPPPIDQILRHEIKHSPLLLHRCKSLSCSFTFISKTIRTAKTPTPRGPRRSHALSRKQRIRAIAISMAMWCLDVGNYTYAITYVHVKDYSSSVAGRISIRHQGETMSFPQYIAPRLLEDRVAFVTGAGQGNGRALALGLAQSGAKVVVSDIAFEHVSETAALIEKQGGKAWPFELDVTNADACYTLADKVHNDIGPVDVLVNNAGIIIRENSTSPNAAKNWKKVMDVNVQGTFNVTHAFLDAIKTTKGVIINVASIAAYAGQGASLGYSPSKGAIKMFTQSLAAELAPHGVRVNALAPGVIETPMTAATRENPARLEAFMSRIPMGRVGQTEDLVGPTIFLASGMSRYVTGVTLAVDGGFLAI